MKHPEPDAKWQQFLVALKEKKAPTDPLVLAVYNTYLGKNNNALYSYACDLARIPDNRDVIVAFFLSGATVEETSHSLHIPTNVLEVFGKLVIDLSTFRNKLELLRYAQEYKRRATKKGAELVELGIVQGPFSLMHYFRHGHEEIPVDAKVYAREMMQQAFYFGMLSRGNSIKAPVTKEAWKWLSTTAGLIKDYDRLLGDSHDSDEALLEIEKKKMTQTPEEFGVNPKEFLH